MPAYPTIASECLEEYCRRLKRRGLMPGTVIGYRRDIERLMRIVETVGNSTHPAKITERDIDLMLTTLRKDGLKPQTMQLYIHSLRGYLRYYGNATLDQMDLLWPPADARTVDWLSPHDAQLLLDAPKTPLQELVIHMELCLGLRRIEVLRLRPDSFRGRDTIMVQGKGRGGAQWRPLPYHPDTSRVLNRYLGYRMDIIARYKRLRPTAAIPSELLIYAVYPGTKQMRVAAYGLKGTGIDKAVLVPLRQQTGLQFSHHTLRRTFARTLWLYGSKIETIGALLGHHSTEVTLRYIGVQHSDMTEALSGLFPRQPEGERKEVI